MLKGIDVSSNNGAVDWTALANAGDVTFAIIKATERVTYNDSRFATNWSGAAAAGLVRGAYHFARPSNNDPTPEADHFLAKVAAAGGLQGGDLLAFDVEDTNVAASLNLLSWALEWLQYVESQVGFKPFFYSGNWYMKPHGLVGDDDLAGYPLWLSSYNRTFGKVPGAPPNWSAVVVHQYDSGSAAGVAGNVDLNCFTGVSVAELAQYGTAAFSVPQTP